MSVLAIGQVISPFMTLEGQVPHMRSIHMFKYKISRDMERDLQIVCGTTFNLTMPLVRDYSAFSHVTFILLLNVLVIFVNSGGPFFPWQFRGLCFVSPSSKLWIICKVSLCPVMNFKASPSVGVKGHLRGH